MSAVATPAPAPRKTGGKACTVSRRARPAGEDRAPETVAAALRRELLITFECNCVKYIGSAQQLIDEGILAATFEFPEGWTAKEEVQAPGCDYARVKRMKPPGDDPALVDRWVVYAWMPEKRRRKPYDRDQWAEDMAAQMKFLMSSAGGNFASRYSDASVDASFQRHMNFAGLVKAAKEVL